MTESNEQDIASFVTFRIARTQARLNAQATKILRAHSDLTLAEWRVLQLLKLFDGGTMSDMAHELDMDKGQLSRNVKTLVQKNLVESEADSADHRKHHLRLTPQAQELRARLMPIMAQRQEALVGDVPREKLDVFFDVLGQIYNAASQR